MKCCTKCGIEKSLSDFSKDSSKATGIKSACKPCNSTQAAAWNKNNKSRYQENLQKWREENPERLKAIDKRYRENNAEKHRASSLRWSVNNPTKHNANTSRQRASLKKAVPSWYEKEAVDIIYTKAKLFGFEVDHIVPLSSKLVCGLHCFANLQLLDKSLNSSKKNLQWPDMP